MQTPQRLLVEQKVWLQLPKQRIIEAVNLKEEIPQEYIEK